MAFCPSCGSQVDGRFCPKCGSAVGDPANMGGTVPPPPAAQAGGLTENMAAALCYLLGILTGVLFLVLAPYNQNRNIRFHAFQSIFVWVACFAIYIVAMILSLTLGAIPVIGWIFSILLYAVIGLGGFILWLMLMYRAYNNEKWVLPIVGPLAEKQAG